MPRAAIMTASILHCLSPEEELRGVIECVRLHPNGVLDRHLAFESRSCRPRKLVSVLEPGASVPDVLVWSSPREEPQPLRQVLGAGLSLLCFYLYDWSPT